MSTPVVAPARFAAVIAAEVIGTLVVTFAVVGATVLGGAVIGTLGVALATGFALAAAIAITGPVSGGHLNPAVTVGLAVSGRFPWRDVPTHVVAQLVGAVTGVALVVAVAADGPAGTLADAQRAGFAAGGFGAAYSPTAFGLVAVAIVEIAAAAALVAAYRATAPTGPAASRSEWTTAALVIGLAVSALALVVLPVSNGSVNPARALATALFGGPERIGQVWAFVVLPLVGALIAGIVARSGQADTQESDDAGDRTAVE